MKQKIISLVLGIVVVLPLSAAGFVVAQESDSESNETTLEQSTAPAQTYGVSSVLRTGTVVQPDPNDSKKVIAASGENLVAAFGIVVPGDDLPISIGEVGGQSTVHVATTGRHSALVTNERGTIQTGDYLALSSLSGTLAKSTEKQEVVFAKALGGFDGKSNVVGSTTLVDADGKPRQQVSIGLIPVAIEIIKNPQQVSTDVNTPDVLKRIGEAIAEKPVDPVRLYIGVGVVVLSVIIAVTLLAVGVRNSIISIGRNPLSKKSIFKGLLQVILTSVLVLIIGLFTVYLLLRL